MHTVMESSTVAGVPTGRTGGQIPARIITSLYELIASIQEVVDPQDDALVVATVVHLLQSQKCSIGQASAGNPSTQKVSHSSSFSGGQLPSYVEGSSASDFPLIHDAQS